MTKVKKQKCGCGNPGLVIVEDGKWLCDWCATERINSPENIQMTSTYAELDDFIDEGGKLN
jgi:hypothetical protein